MKSTIIVCEYGWILVGQVSKATKDTITLENASVVRRWNNGRGIGALAQEKYKSDYMLDEIGGVEIRTGKVLFQIPCEW